MRARARGGAPWRVFRRLGTRAPVVERVRGRSLSRLHRARGRREPRRCGSHPRSLVTRSSLSPRRRLRRLLPRRRPAPLARGPNDGPSGWRGWGWWLRLVAAKTDARVARVTARAHVGGSGALFPLPFPILGWWARGDGSSSAQRGEHGRVERGRRADDRAPAPRRRRYGRQLQSACGHRLLRRRPDRRQASCRRGRRRLARHPGPVVWVQPDPRRVDAKECAHRVEPVAGAVGEAGRGVVEKAGRRGEPGRRGRRGRRPRGRRHRVPGADADGGGRLRGRRGRRRRGGPRKRRVGARPPPPVAAARERPAVARRGSPAAARARARAGGAPASVAAARATRALARRGSPAVARA